MKIAAAYLRVSTDRQDEYSLDSQLKLIREYASKNDMLVPEEFVFCDDGISGRSAEKRPEFQRMISHAKAKGFELILVWKFSRFARNQEESIVYKSMLQRLGVEVVSVSEPLAEGPFGDLIERILEWMDEFYSIRLAGEVKRGMTEKVSRGQPVTQPSFGYDIKDGVYVPNSDAPVVRRIFEAYVAGQSLVGIAKVLSAEGIRTRRGRPPENRFVSYVLDNPVYIGKIRWSKDGKVDYHREYSDNENIVIVDGNHEPLISSELWNKVQDRRQREKRGRRKWERLDQPVEWMLKGLVRCGDCGSTLCYTALSCPSMQCYKYAHGTCAVSHSLSIAKANRLVTEALENFAELGIFPLAPQCVQPSVDGPDYPALIRAEEGKLQRVYEAYESGIDSLEEYGRKKARISAGIKKLRSEAAAAQQEAASISQDPEAFKSKVLSVLDIIKDGTQTEKAKNTALKSIISYIVYQKPSNQLEIYFYI